jgi:hypothetical protein
MPFGFGPWICGLAIILAEARDDWLAQMRADDDGMKNCD